MGDLEGTVQRVSQGRTVTESDIVTWAGLVHDFTPLHVDAHLMSSSMFGSPIAHGYIALNFSIGLMFPDLAAWYAPDGGYATVGWDDVRFFAPVRVGDTLRCRRTVLDNDGPETWHLVEMLNQDDVVVVRGTERMRPVNTV